MQNSSKLLVLAVAASLIAPAAAFAEGAGKRGAGRLDADGDGAITLSDMRAQRAAMFDRIDADKDGRVTPDERAAARKNAPERRKAARADRPERSGDRTETTIARADFIASAERRFALLDADGDGKLTREEMKAGRKGRAAR
ncbi:hypothetical protein GE300_14585 [Rhodobacteraceae bacterium 2CG4]|uniref:EF-hand domain-containing protein n=1 Tax=Halovulum marinum TaxID=2662447 RepID=A0A6L5Z2Q9_9RHOB|nr:hypothetical protein [Halovulum marinum]MSU90828.1 hypothetical protein [Halovulum marinum]